MTKLFMRKSIGFPLSSDEQIVRAENTLISWVTWQKKIEEIEKKIIASKIHILLVEILYTKVLVKFLYTSSEALIKAEEYGTYQISNNAIKINKSLITDIDKIIEAYKSYEANYHRLRAVSLKCEILHFIGEYEKAKKEAEELAKEADDFHYEDIKTQAIELIEGKTIYKTMLDKLQNLNDEEWFSIATDDQLKKFADHTITMLGIPVDRTDNVLKSFKTTRYMFQLKKEWCMYLNIYESREYSSSLQTVYLTDPDKICHCSLYNKYESKITTKNVADLVNAFKQFYCSNCNGRKLKN